MRLGVNVPNFGPGTSPDILRRWALTAEGLGFDLLMISDHVAVTPDVAGQYPAPFYEPFTTLAWLAGQTRDIRLGTTVLIVPYRHPLLMARMAANLNDLSGGRLVLGVGVGWAEQEFAALGVPFRQRGRLTDEYLLAMRAAWQDSGDYRSGPIPIWVGGNSDAALRRAARLGDAWHPLRFTPDWIEVAAGLRSAATGPGRPAPAFAPRMALRLSAVPVTDAERLAGHGTPGADRRGPGAVARAGRRGGHPRSVQRRPGRDQAPRRGVAGAGGRRRPAHRADPGHRDRTERPVTSPEPASDLPAGVVPADLQHLRRCVELAAEAVVAGDFPFGSVLTGVSGEVLAEDRNRENSLGDATRHPEFELARWAATNMTATDRAAATVYHLGRALPAVLGGARLGRAGPHRLRQLVHAADRLAGRAGRAAVPGACPGHHRHRTGADRVRSGAGPG